MDRKSFNNLKNWVSMAKKHATKGANIVIIGNKIDCKGHRREVSTEDARNFATRNGCAFFEVSALKKTNIRAIQCLSAS
jgi:small GTP-binding protein